MPRILATEHGADQLPAALQSLVSLGLDLQVGSAGQAVTQCPFCEKPKFYVSVSTGLWDCKACGRSGNTVSFLRQLWEQSDLVTRDYGALAAERKLLAPETLIYWEAAQSLVTGEWILPGQSVDGKLTQLYRRTQFRDKQGKLRWKLAPTTAIPHALHAASLFQKGRKTVYVAEGYWDGAALWEILRLAKTDGSSRDGMSRLVHTASPESSLLAEANVIAVPGANVWKEEWGQLCAGAKVVLLYDNDHARTINGRQVPGAGPAGAKSVAQKLASWESPPASISRVEWGSNDGIDTTLPDGWDVRDHLAVGTTVEQRLEQLRLLLAKVKPIPAEWVAGRSASSQKSGSAELQCLACDSWKVLSNACRLAMQWHEGLDRAMSVVLASIVSVDMYGDQLWIKMLGPPSCGKSEICEAVSVNKKYVYANSTMRGFHSGFQTDRKGTQDHSLIPKIAGKTLVTKDGDTLLQSPNRSLILSEGRDLYDKVSRTHYRNSTSRSYENIRMTWILAGTESLRELDGSELGERFLDCVIMEGIDEQMESEINVRRFFQVVSNRAMVANGTASSGDAESKLKMRQLTGGYINYLRQNVGELMAALTIDDALASTFDALATFVAHMRARPSKRQDESEGREMSARLVSQLTRLGLCLAVVLNRPSIDQEVIRRVARTALDTARGKTLKMTSHLYASGVGGSTVAGISVATNQPEEKIRKLLHFLAELGAVEQFDVRATGLQPKKKWRLSAKMRNLYKQVRDVSEL